MPLTLVIGPANSAKAGEVLGAYALAARGGTGPPPLLVVPTAADAAHYDRELAEDGLALGRTLTPGALLEEIAGRVGLDAPPLGPLQRACLLRRLVSGARLGPLRESARGPGFALALVRLLDELAAHRVSAPRFAAALRAWAAEDPAREAYARDLSALVLGFAEWAARDGRQDAIARGWAALDALRAEPHRWHGAPVFFYGFDDLTPLERDAVETLARVAGAPVTVSLTYEPGRVALAARAGVVAELAAFADTVRELPARDEYYAPDARAALHHLERWLFEPGAPVLDPGGAVRLLEAGGERVEAELVLAEVLAALRAGTQPWEVAVVCRSLRRSGALLQRTLERAGVPVDCARRVPVADTAIGRGVLALLRCATDPGASSEELLAYLRTPGVATPDAVDALELAVRQRGLTTAAEARAAWTGRIAELDTPPPPTGEAAAWLAGHVRRLLAAPHLREGRAFDAAERQDARAARAILAATAELAGEALTASELLDVLTGLEAGPEASLPGAVLITEPLAVRARRFRLVVVCGLVDGEFPAPSAPDPFLGEERRRELAQAAALRLDPEEDALARERHLLYACVSRATERVILSTRSSDEDGNVVLPSPFLDDLAAVFGPDWLERRRIRRLADVVFSPEEAPTLRDYEIGCAEVAARRLATSEVASPRDGERTRVLGAAARAHVRHTGVVSGGALEAFARCPVAWLVERQLAPEELAPEATPLVQGSFMHAVLERVVSGLDGALTPASLPEAERLLDVALAEVPVRLAPGRPEAVRRALLRGIEADLRRYLRHEAGDGCEWTPVATELSFGMESSEEGGDGLPELVLSADGESVRVRGVIDRIDVEPGGRRAIVRDYKSGSSRPERAGHAWAEGEQFQVALYMLAVRRLLSLEPVGGFFQPLSGGELRGRGAYLEGAPVGTCAFPTDAFDPAELESLLAEIEAEAVEVAGTLRRGELTPCPETCSRDGCRHPGICWADR